MHCHAEPSQTAAGGLYPGGLVARLGAGRDARPAQGRRRRPQTPHHTFRSQVDFASNQPHEGSPVTEFRADRRTRRDFGVLQPRLRFPDGAEHEMWSFEDDTSGRADSRRR